MNEPGQDINAEGMGCIVWGFIAIVIVIIIGLYFML